MATITIKLETAVRVICDACGIQLTRTCDLAWIERVAADHHKRKHA